MRINSRHSPFSSLLTPTMPVCSHIPNFPRFHLSFPVLLSLFGVLHHICLHFFLFPQSAICGYAFIAPWLSPILAPLQCLGSGPYSCFNCISGFKLLLASCHSSVSASHHCQRIPLTLLCSLS